MARKVTLFTGQWADLPIEKLCPMAREMGYDGLELACWGDHFEVEKAAASKKYCDGLRALLARHGLGCWAISNHLAGQLVCDPNNDSRSDAFAPRECRGKPEAKRAWGIKQMMKSAAAARNMGVSVVNGFTGSPIWHMIYAFPPVSEAEVEKGFARFAELWRPILAEFRKNRVKFALEAHPTEIAFDLLTAERALKAMGDKSFGFNFDPSHLFWQGVAPERFLYRFGERIFHVHMKDAAVTLDGEAGILSSHLPFGDPRRGWNFRSVGRGGIRFEEIIRALNAIGYQGPLSVEWEDSAMERIHGATESAAYVRKLDFAPSHVAFDAQFDK